MWIKSENLSQDEERLSGRRRGWTLRTFVKEPVDADKSFFSDSLKKLTANWMNGGGRGTCKQVIFFFFNLHKYFK